MSVRHFNFRFVANVPDDAKIGVVRSPHGELLVMVSPGEPAKTFNIDQGCFEEIPVRGGVPLKAVR